MSKRCWGLAVVIFSIVAPEVQANEVRMRFLDPKVGFRSDHVLRIGTAITMDSRSQYAGLGAAVKNSYMMYFDWLNHEHGGVVVNGTTHMVELILVDDNSSTTRVRTITNYLIDTLGLRILLGPYSSELTEIAAVKANTSKSLLVAAGASSPSVFQGRPTVFGTLPISSEYMTGGFKVLGAADGGSNKTLAIVQEDKDWTLGTCSVVPALARASNMRVVSDGIFTVPADANEDQVKSVVSSLSQITPDIVAMCTYRIACHSLLKQMRSQKFYAKAIMATICVTEADFIDVLGMAGQFVMGVTPWQPELPFASELVPGWTAQSYATEYQTRHGSTPPYQGASAFCSCALLVRAIEDANSLDPLLVADKLQAADHATLCGSITFDANGQAKQEMKLVQHQGLTKPLLIHPPQSANGAFGYPKPAWADMECTNVNPDSKSRYGLSGDRCIECELGMQSKVVISGSGTPERLCVKCPAGKMGADSAYQFCFDCRIGSFSSVEGADQCMACSIGTSQNSSGQSACDVCPPGRFTQRTGNGECQDCAAGFIQPLAGQSVCLPCERGSYVSGLGKTSCVLCPGVDTASPYTTKYTGATAIDQCKCQEGYYVDSSVDGVCKTCASEALECEFGLELKNIGKEEAVQPRLLKGYWSSPADPMKPYKCNPPESCPGGAVGSCSGGRIGIACGECPIGFAPSGQSCKKCEAWNKIFGSVFPFLVFFSPLLLYALTAIKHRWRLTPREALGLTFEIVIEVVQVIGAVTLMNVDWPAPRMLDILAKMNLDDWLPYLGIAPCVLRSNRDAIRYIVNLSVIPALIASCWILHPIMKRYHYRAEARWTFRLTWNMTGKIFNMLFVSQLTWSLMPFMCYRHPAPNSNSQSILQFPATTCDSSEHVVMLSAGVLSLLLCVAFFANVCVSVWIAPTKLKRKDGRDFMSMIGYIVEDFRLECYYFNILAKLQELSVALVLAVAPNDVRLQILAFSCIFVFSLGVLAKFWPIKSPLVNLMLVLAYAMLILVLGAIQAVLPAATGQDLDNAGVSIAVYTIFVYVIIGASLVLGVVNILVHGGKGQLFWMAQLQRQPDLDQLACDWEYASWINSSQMEALIAHWQIYDVNHLCRVLQVIQPSGVEGGLMQTDGRLRISAAGLEHLLSETVKEHDDTEGVGAAKRPSLDRTNTPAIGLRPERATFQQKRETSSQRRSRRISKGGRAIEDERRIAAMENNLEDGVCSVTHCLQEVCAASDCLEPQQVLATADITIAV